MQFWSWLDPSFTRVGTRCSRSTAHRGINQRLWMWQAHVVITTPCAWCMSLFSDSNHGLSFRTSHKIDLMCRWRKAFLWVLWVSGLQNKIMNLMPQKNNAIKVHTYTYTPRRTQHTQHTHTHTHPTGTFLVQNHFLPHHILLGIRTRIWINLPLWAHK